MLFVLLAGHALGDYAWQTEAIATCKCPGSTNPLQKSVPWPYWLTAHSLVHGGIVAVIVKWWGHSADAAVALGIAETAIHFAIDFAKCRNLFGMAIDQWLHVGCKVAWWAILAKGMLA
jgi:hypothetical protein